MRKLLGIPALVGLVVAAAMALAGIAGFDIPARSLAWLPVLTKVELLVALAALLLAFRRGLRFRVPREVTAGALALVLVLVVAVLVPGRVADGRPGLDGASYVVRDQQGAIVRGLSEEQYWAARRAQDRVECAVMAIFLYVATLAFLVPAGVWSVERPRRRFDFIGAAVDIRGTEPAP